MVLLKTNGSVRKEVERSFLASGLELLELNLRSSLVMVISRYTQLDVAKAILAQGLDLTYSCYRSFSGKGTVGKGHLQK